MPQTGMVIIGLSPTLLRVRRGSDGPVEVIAVNSGAWESNWSENLTALDHELTGALRRLGVKPGASAICVYQGLHTVTDVVTVPLEGEAAVDAATLAFRDTIGADVDWMVGMSKLRTCGGSTHFVASAESVAASEVLNGFITRANLRLRALIPAKAASVRAAVDATSGSESLRVHIWLGENTTILTAVDHGRLVICRALDFGYGALVDALVRAADADYSFRPTALEHLRTFGLPGGRGYEAGEAGLSAEVVRPLIQPVLQRYALEIKQTLRFGSTQTDLSRETIMIEGPGAGIKGLLESFELHFDANITRAETCAPLNHGETGGLDLERTVRLEPPSLTVRNTARSVRWAVAAGTAATLAVAMGTGLWAHTRTAEIARTKDQLAARASELAEYEALCERATALAANLEDGANLAAKVIGPRPAWGAMLAALTRLANEQIEIIEVTGSFASESAGAATMSLRGVAWPPAASGSAGPRPMNGRDSLSEFIASLAQCSMVRKATLQSTRSAERADAKSFLIVLELRAMSPNVFAPATQTANAVEVTP